jgi:hypothetical protein
MFRGSGHAVKLWRDWPVATTLKPEVIADVFCVCGRNLKLQVAQQRVFAMRLPPRTLFWYGPRTSNTSLQYDHPFYPVRTPQ